MKKSELQSQIERMRADWDDRARQNARYFVNTAKADWTDEEFFQSGELTVKQEILTDMTNICQGKDPRQMSVLEIGCGAGRVTRALAGVFGVVPAVDVSGEMVRQARLALAGCPNVHVYRNNGTDLTVLEGCAGRLRRWGVPSAWLPAPVCFDFAFSTIVFQHIPSREIIENYVREVHRLLRPGGLFKFQVQGDATLEDAGQDTWLGIPFSDEQAVDMALRCGFEPRYRHGAGQQYFWLWYFRK